MSDQPKTVIEGERWEAAVEAYASGFPELVELAPDERARLESSPRFRDTVARERARAIDVGLLLREAGPRETEVDYEAMVSRAIDRAPLPASRRSLALGFVFGLAATVGLTVATFAFRSGSFSIPELPAALSWLLAVGGAVDRIVSKLPAGWNGLALAVSSLMILLAWPTSRLLRAGKRIAESSAARGAAALLLGASVVAAPEAAHAQSFEGTWSPQTVSVALDDATPSDALRQVCGAAGLGLALRGTLPDEPTITLHVEGAPLRDVLRIVLSDDALSIERVGSLLVVDRGTTTMSDTPEAETTAPAPREDTPAAPSPMEPPPPPSETISPPPPPPVPSISARGGREIVTFGDDAHVGPGEVVETVATMGGNILIEGHVLGDVVTMGGDVTLRGEGRVDGQLVTFGGEIELEDGAAQPQRIVTAQPEEDDVGDAMGGFALFGLLFITGLMLIGLGRERHARVARTIMEAPGRSVAVGLLGIIGSALGTILLAITIVGVLAIPVLWIFAFFAALSGLATLASVVGALIPIGALQGKPVAQLGAGVLVFFVLAQVPVINLLSFIACALVGFGSVLLSRLGTRTLDDL